MFSQKHAWKLELYRKNVFFLSLSLSCLLGEGFGDESPGPKAYPVHGLQQFEEWPLFGAVSSFP